MKGGGQDKGREINKLTYGIPRFNSSSKYFSLFFDNSQRRNSFICLDTQYSVRFRLYVLFHLISAFFSFLRLVASLSFQRSYFLRLKFGDSDGPNLCRVKKQMLVPHFYVLRFVSSPIFQCSFIFTLCFISYLSVQFHIYVLFHLLSFSIVLFLRFVSSPIFQCSFILTLCFISYL